MHKIMINMVLMIFILLFFPLVLNAKNLGEFGQVYAISEKNMLDWIYQKLEAFEKSGKIQALQDEFKSRSLASIMRPKSVPGISHTKEERKFFYDPSITLSAPIISHDGKHIYQAGETLNPLDKISLKNPIIFIDGDSPEQVAWALGKYKQNSKIILIQGNIIDLMQQHQHPFFFDQNGVLVSKLGIKQVPAIVKQFGNKLQIHEVRL